MELTKEQIEFLDVVVRGTWIINSNGEVDVDGGVDVANMNLTEIPVKFGSVSGTFRITHTPIKNTHNFPNVVSSVVSSVDISRCYNLTSIENLPTTIKPKDGQDTHIINITSNRKLKSLKGIENVKIIPNRNDYKNLYVRVTENDLTSLDYITEFLDNNPIVKNINLYGNKNLKEYFDTIDKDNFKYWDRIYFSIIYDFPNLFPYIYPHLNESDKGNFKLLMKTNQHLKLYI